MTSPDIDTYLGFDVVDLDAETIAANALAAAATAEGLEDATFAAGAVETVLLEQVAAVAAEMVYSINELPAGITERVLGLLRMTRDVGAPVTASVRFILGDTSGATLPAGLMVRLATGSDGEGVDLTLDADLVIPAGAASGVGACTGVEYSTAGNGTPAGVVLEVVDAVASLSGAALEGPVGGGRAPEDGTAFLDRCVPTLGRLTSTIVLPSDVQRFAAAVPGVARAVCLDLHNPAAPGVTSPGYVTVVVMGAGGVEVPAGDRDAIRDALRERMHAGLVVSVVSPAFVTVNVSVRVLRRTQYTDAAVIAAVQAKVAEWLDPLSWGWGGVVRINELIAQVDGAAGVDVVLSLDGPLADIPLVGVAAAPSLGTVSVTVVAP